MSLSRIAYVVYVFPKISETFIAREIIELEKRGVEVMLFALQRSLDTWQHAFIDEYGLVDRCTYDRQGFSRLIADRRPDLIHAHFATEPTDFARALSLEHGIPFTFTAHGYDVYRKPPRDFRERAIASAGVFTVSQANAEHLQRAFGVPGDRLHVVPCGVPMDHSAATTHPEVPHLVCVARLEPVKRLEMLLQACSILKRRSLRFQCTVIGEGSCREMLAEMRQKLDLSDTVRLIGARDQQDVWRSWRQASLAVLTSTSEGMPVSLMEAAACGVPAVATAVGGIPELIEHNVTGLLVPRDDVHQLADAIYGLLSNPHRLAQFGDAALQRAKTKFSLHRQVDALLDVWSKFLLAR